MEKHKKILQQIGQDRTSFRMQVIIADNLEALAKAATSSSSTTARMATANGGGRRTRGHKEKRVRLSGVGGAVAVAGRDKRGGREREREQTAERRELSQRLRIRRDDDGATKRRPSTFCSRRAVVAGWQPQPEPGRVAVEQWKTNRSRSNSLSRPVVPPPRCNGSCLKHRSKCAKKW